ncbi:uncharacterized protein DDB_G0271850-like [Oppia nitens]|uniref:uncharacterized protein DDB_G0271850-like n=1 Tax=Oppia nitens TaxID=1686743 RepID=UPI0023DAA29B|nr:uncharacterized protein DDB_G0271850-like [Oppia nitens]
MFIINLLPWLVLILVIILIESNNQVKCNYTNINITGNNTNNGGNNSIISGININNSGNNSNSNKIKLPDLPPISLMTSKMTGRWYAIYSTNRKISKYLDIENVFGSNPSELKLTLGNYKDLPNIGYTILDDLNGMYVTYTDGGRIYYNILDYDFERYLVMRSEMRKNAHLNVFSRFNDKSSENVRLLNNIYRKLDRLGLKFNLKQINQQKPSNRRFG